MAHSGLPLTDREKRIEQARARKRGDQRLRRILACPSGQDYNRQPTPADKAILARSLGEKDDDLVKAS